MLTQAVSKTKAGRTQYRLVQDPDAKSDFLFLSPLRPSRAQDQELTPPDNETNNQNEMLELVYYCANDIATRLRMSGEDTFSVDDLRHEFDDMISFLDEQLGQMRYEHDKKALRRTKHTQQDTVARIGSLCEHLVKLGAFAHVATSDS